MPSLTLTHILLAALLAGGIALIAGLMRLLTFSGALAAFVVGFLVFALGSLPMALPLLAFFFSSSLLSRLGRRRKARQSEIYAKGASRDAVQVLANGLVPAITAVAFALSPATRFTMLLYLAALSAVNADTWATEIGGLMPGRPRLVSTLRSVEPGTSGAVTLGGLLAALAGAYFIAAVAWLAWPTRSLELFQRIDAPEIIAITWAGFVAAYADSLLGATLQAQYRCPKCGAITERPMHCGLPANRYRGFRWITNDAVNLVTSLCGLLFGWLLLRYFAYPL